MTVRSDSRTRRAEADGELLVLAALAEQARMQGVSVATVRALVAQASEEGARRALQRAGLADGKAGRDIRELRTLLDAWRTARRTAAETLVRWLVTLLLCGVLAGLALKLRLWPPA